MDKIFVLLDFQTLILKTKQKSYKHSKTCIWSLDEFRTRLLFMKAFENGAAIN